MDASDFAARQIVLVVTLGLAGACCTQPAPCPDSTTQSAGVLDIPPPTGPPVFSTTAIPIDAAKYPYNHVASIAEMPNGDLLTVWGAGSAELARDTVIVASRKPKGTDAWLGPKVVVDKPNAADANPLLFVDPTGVVWLFHVEMFGDTFCLGRVFARTSNDNGETWNSPRQVLDAVCTMIKNKPIITRTGRWILPAYQQAIYQSQFWISDDRGAAWKSTAAILTLGNNNLQPAVAELPDGSLLALMRNSGSAGFTWEGRSTDRGTTWCLKERRDLPNPNSGLDLIRLVDGRLLFVYDNSPKERTPLVAAISADGGNTWSSPKIIESGDPQLSYPSVIQTKDGMIHVVYSHRLTHIQYASFNLSWLLSPSPPGRGSG